METDIETKYCQSCGMPLDIEDITEYGTNSDGTLNQEFCSCCLNSGKYLFNFSMEYLIYLWGLFPDSYNQIAGTNYKSEELRNVLSDRLPNLKRWKQKINTAHIHYDLIMNVQEYINRHLFEDLNCDNLSHVACMSMYHFRRVFKDVVGENVGDYIQRLRLEYIAFKLISTNTRVSELLEQINFQNKHTLSRAFKKHFQMSIPAFRKVYSNVAYENKIIKQLEYSIKRIKEIKVAYLKFERTHRNKQAYSTLWKQIMEFAKKYNLTDKGFKYVSISLDSLDITEIDKCRFLIGITVPYSMEIPKGFSVLNIQTGLYSVFNIKGRYHELNRIYRDIYLDWLPNSKYSLREQMTFEIYTNTPDKASMEELVTEIYLPIEVKQKDKMKDEIIQFLKENIIGKTLLTGAVYKLENGNLEGVYNDKMTFSNLVTTGNGFKFDMTTVTQELVYNLDDKGARTTIAKDYTGTSVFCYELAMRKSTKQITGYMRCVSTTVQDSTMEAVVCGIFDVTFDGKELKWQENQLLYRDNPIGEDKYKPVAFNSKVRFYLDNGKVVFEYLPTLWDISPDTLEKRLSKDDYPPYISKEQ